MKINVIANPAVNIGFVGEEITKDPEYANQKSACIKAATRRLKDLSKTKPERKVKIGDPIEFGPAILNDLPAWARVNAYQKAREAVNLSKMANAYLPDDQARMVIATLVADVPGLDAAMQIRLEKDTATSY